MSMDFTNVLKGSSLDKKSQTKKDTIKTIKKISFMDFLDCSREVFFETTKNLDNVSIIIDLMDMYSTIMSEVSILLFYDAMPDPQVKENRYKKVNLCPTEIVGAFSFLMESATRTHKIIKDFPIIKDIVIHVAMEIINKFWDIDWNKERLDLSSEEM